jgi:hypothetical protein
MSTTPLRAATTPLDRGVALVLLTRLVPLLAAPVTLWLVATQRPLAEQGLYFIFWNAQALTQLMELGMGGLVVQFASHEAPFLAWDARGGLSGDEGARTRMHDLVREGRRWYGMVALALLVLGGVGGAWLLETRSAGVSPAPLAPWIVTIVCTATYLPLVPILCAVEGCGGLLRVQRMRLAQVSIAMASLWIVLPRWGALWAVAVFAVAWLAVAWGWLRAAHRGLLEEIGGAHELRTMVLTGVQWRTGASWLAWWAAPQALTPIVLATHGAAHAGRVGMTVAIAMAPYTLANAWLQGRYPSYGALIARGEAAELQGVARMATLQAVCVFLLGTGGAALAVWLLSRFAPALAARALSPAALVILGAGNLGWLLVQSLGSYLRAWREEPLMEASVVGAALVIGGTLAAAALLSTLGTVAAHSLLVLGIVLPLALIGYRRHHRGVRPETKGRVQPSY